ncbi:MAG: MarR family transcriptional regulator [Clostridia bacterium]|nr:MarR family transcriptional regulator [Clostridia bacterium]
MNSSIMDSLAGNLIQLLPLLHSTVINLDDFNTDADLGRAHYEILACLDSVEYAVPMTGVSKAMNISKPYLTTLTDRLISKDYIERVPEPADRRVIKIALTSKGRALIREHFAMMRKAVVEKLAALNASETEQLASALLTVTAILGKFKGVKRQ